MTYEMSLWLKGQHFVHTIGTTQYLILTLKHNILTEVSKPHFMNDIDASLQNTILKCVFAVCNILKSMCQKISMPIPPQVHNYIYNSPVPIRDRPLLIKNFASFAINLLHQLRTSFILHDNKLPRETQTHTHTGRVHFYLYLLEKILRTLNCVIKRLAFYELL